MTEFLHVSGATLNTALIAKVEWEIDGSELKGACAYLSGLPENNPDGSVPGIVILNQEDAEKLWKAFHPGVKVEPPKIG
ncbi:hypothetical protein ACN4EK_03970 [Pantanalinema rosaneae CENA516]|uniref:hypothetical protein n=1 Tax=Pantanalinema rosaneae TaxID=1620701 RepID=UPI003D6FB8DA